MTQTGETEAPRRGPAGPRPAGVEPSGHEERGSGVPLKVGAPKGGPRRDGAADGGPQRQGGTNGVDAAARAGATPTVHDTRSLHTRQRRSLGVGDETLGFYVDKRQCQGLTVPMMYCKVAGVM